MVLYVAVLRPPWLAAIMEPPGHVPTQTPITIEQLESDATHWQQLPQLVHQMVVYVCRVDQMSMKEGLKCAMVVSGHQYVTLM